MPALNEKYTRQWTQADINKFHRLPYWTAVVQDKVTKDVQVHSKLLGRKKWEANKGKILRTIIPQPTPQLRQFWRPAPHGSLPRVDTVNPGQRELTDYVFEHQIASDYLSWIPEFYDLLSQHENYVKDVAKRVALFPELTARTYVFHMARHIMFCGKEADPTTPALEILGRDIIMGPQGTGEESDNDTDPTTGKTLSWLKANVLKMTGARGLTIANVHRACTFMAQQQMRPWKGSNSVAKENGIADGMYLLVLGNETNRQWIYDPMARSLGGANLDMLGGDFTRPLLKQFTTLTEDTPIRLAIDPSTKDLSIPEPQTVVLTGENAGETIPNPVYNSAAIEVAWLYSGENFGNMLDVGPPPSAFAKNGPSGLFAKLNWNGEIITYTPPMVQVPAVGGGLTWIDNRDKRFMQIFADVAGGIQGIQKRAAFPILFYRNIGTNPITNNL